MSRRVASATAATGSAPVPALGAIILAAMLVAATSLVPSPGAAATASAAAASAEPPVASASAEPPAASPAATASPCAPVTEALVPWDPWSWWRIAQAAPAVPSPDATSPSACPEPSSTPGPSPSPSPTARPDAVEPGRVRVARDVPFMRRVRCHELPGDGCLNTADIYHPANANGWPTVITVHGRPRTPLDMRELAHALAADGAVVYNVDYRGVRPVSKGFPEAISDVACAVRYARATTARYGGDPEHIVIVGHSMGGYVGMMVALAGDGFPGRQGDCLVETGSSLPDGMVHLAGVSLIYDQNPIDITFFGGRREDIPGVWHRGDLYNHMRGNRDLRVGIIFERNDPILSDPHATLLAWALERSRHDTTLVMLDEGDSHFDVLDMDTPLGRRVLRFTQRIIRQSGPE